MKLPPLVVAGIVVVTACAVTACGPPPPPQVWQPKPGTTWQWQITGTVDTTVTPADMFDIDLQDAVPQATTMPNGITWPKGVNAGVISTLHTKNKIVICYMDSGAYENYRPDAKLFPASVIGNNTGWSGENWLDIRSSAWSKFESIITTRMDLAKQIGCDGIEPDQNNPWGNNPGFPITLADQKAWYLEVASQAHTRSLSVGQKNGIETTDADTVKAFDWNLNEECFQYNECNTLSQFINADKAVFNTEYQGSPSTICPKAQALGFSTLFKHLSLDTYRVACF